MATPTDRLRHHVTGAIERGEAVPIIELSATLSPPEPAFTEPRDMPHMLALTKRDAFALIRTIDEKLDDLGIVDAEDDPELAHLVALRGRIVELYGAPDAEPLRYTAKHVGNVDEGSHGTDSVYLLIVNPDDEPPSQARIEAEFSAAMWQESRGPGSRYCTSVTVCPIPHSDGMKWYATAHIRWDV